MEKTLLKVQGMSCNHCVKAIEGSVGELSGVERVLVDLNEGEVAVEYNPEQVTIDKIKETIDDQGYDVE
ncbi:copper chaperone CopZ [Peribacillus deserti]|uniref:Copper chaperone CopZ n=1 Tax=Peribacillus deserti TaxID=673318 RepID=A0A2N5LZI8_9BACI|nr:copper chaperone CopZ [Peribacillus deserti]PLT27536.1 copper resistance protein CopZ [Peribacillus deserti]